jgi:DNA invertase Pin-like site-specific DNA recombinase
MAATKRQGRRGVGYDRYSRLGVRDAAKLRTLDAQADQRQDAADQYGVKLVASFEDRGKSGGTLDRPGLQSALKMIEDGDAQVLVAAKLSRLARSTRGSLEIIERVTKAGGQVVLGDIGVIDASSAVGKLLVTILAAVAEMELDLAKEHGHDARSSAIERGVAIMARAPFGYNRPEVRLVPDDVKGPVVTEVFARRAAGATWSELTDYVEAETGVFLTAQTLQKMIANPTYLGSVRSGELMNGQAHPPLTDAATFEAAQSTRRLNSARKHRSLLAGLLTCSGCGNPMTFKQVWRKKGEPFPTYACQRASADGRCPLPVTVSAAMADEAVSESFLAWAAEFEAAGDPRDVAELTQAEQALAEAEAGLVKWLALDLASIVDAGAYRAALADRQALVDDARDALTELRQGHRVEGLRASVAETWPTLDSEGRRQMIAGALDGVLVHRAATRGGSAPFSERAVITWRDA